MSHSSVCDIAGSGHVCDITSVQLKREDLLKMKCTQLERQVNMLQAALQVRLCQSVIHVQQQLLHLGSGSGSRASPAAR